MSSQSGTLCLVLHSHLPFVRHLEMVECLEEDWFFEALTEVYCPLLDLFSRLEREGIDFKIALSLSPPLVAMFQDSLLRARYDHHLENLIRLAESECRRTAGSIEFQPLARMYHERFVRMQEFWTKDLGRDIVGAFRRLGQTGHLELLTTAATHGFLPLMEVCPSAARAQIEVGCESFRQAFGFRPTGFWLPECGFSPGLDQVLADAGIQYTFVETHGLVHATPRPDFESYAPVLSPSGIAFFGRDPETARQVWSSVEGYPGDGDYRDFYRDIGFDLDEETLKPFLYHGGLRVATGIKYFRITGRTDTKEPYRPEWAYAKAQQHADNFLFNRERQGEHLSEVLGRPPVIVAMYDAELFGHWWFEGPVWLEAVFRKFQACRSIVQLSTPSQVLRDHPPLPSPSRLHLSTWGWKGYNEMWLQESNAWIYRHLHRASWRMEELVSAHPQAQGLFQQALTQSLRELFLAQSSDWAFILAQKTASGYATMQIKRHLSHFNRLYEQIRDGRIDEKWLQHLEEQDNLFPFLDYRVYRSKN